MCLGDIPLCLIAKRKTLVIATAIVSTLEIAVSFAIPVIKEMLKAYIYYATIFQVSRWP